MTPLDVDDRVGKVAAISGDPEAAHGYEDQLHQDVLAAIAGGAPHAAELARQALRTREIEFARWYA